MLPSPEEHVVLESALAELRRRTRETLPAVPFSTNKQCLEEWDENSLCYVPVSLLTHFA